VIHKTILALAIGFILLCSGCVAYGTSKDYHPFDPVGLETIQPGKTTAAEVTALFGSPTGTVELSNGNAYIYNRSVAKVSMVWLVIVSFANYDTQVDQIVFFFDRNDLMTHYGVNLNADKAKYGLPF
jgi:hypothetical protein